MASFVRVALGIASVASLGACQLLLPDEGGGGAGSTGNGTQTSATGIANCDEKSALTTDTNECAGDRQCSGFCKGFATACGNGFDEFKAGCCKACAAFNTLPGTPFCCRADLIQKGANCQIIPFGNNSAACGTELDSFCAIANQACGTLATTKLCKTAMPDVVSACASPLYAALADTTQCGDLALCVNDHF